MGSALAVCDAMPMRRFLHALSLTLVACPVSAQTCASDWLERRAPSSIGDDAMAPAMDALLGAYRRSNPDTAQPLDWEHSGQASAMATLMFARADLAPITRPFTAAELAPYDHQYRGDMMKAPMLVRVGTVDGKPAQIAVNRRPDSPLPERVAGFLAFALSPMGQTALAATPGFAALDASALTAERARLPGFIAALDPDLPLYRPVAGITGAIRSVGSDGMKDLVDGWECRFAALQPGVAKGERWEHFGTLNGFHALLGDEADIAPMGRELWPQEAADWRRLFGTSGPVEIRVARGGFNTPQRTTTQAIFVHPANPIARLNMAQLAAVFGAQPSITRWGQLGLSGIWADRSIHIRMPPRIAPNAMSLQMLLGLPGWVSSAVEAPYAATAQALLADPLAIGFGGLEEGVPGLKPLAIAPGESKDFVQLDSASAANGRYPLTRFMFIRLADGRPAPHVLQFLRYVLSREGQERVRYSGYFPLTAAEARVELAKLEELQR